MKMAMKMAMENGFVTAVVYLYLSKALESVSAVAEETHSTQEFRKEACSNRHFFPFMELNFKSRLMDFRTLRWRVLLMTH